MLGHQEQKGSKYDMKKTETVLIKRIWPAHIFDYIKVISRGQYLILCFSSKICNNKAFDGLCEKICTQIEI